MMDEYSKTQNPDLEAKKPVFTEVEEPKGILTITTDFGGRRFKMQVHINAGIISNHIENLMETNIEPGSIRQIYTAAKEKSQELADRYKKIFQFQFYTSNPKLIEWAKTSGNEIFSWDTMEEKTQNNLKFISCLSLISPTQEL